MTEASRQHGMNVPKLIARPERGSARSDPQATVVAAYGSAIASALAHAGIAPEPVFRRLGVDLALRNDPLHRLPVATVNRLIAECANLTGDEYFGLKVAKFLHLSNLHALGFGLMASSTLLDFCERLHRYMRLVSYSARMETRVVGDDIQLVAHPTVDVGVETQDAWAAFLMYFMRLLCRGELTPLRVELCRPAPAGGDGPFRELLAAPVSFGREEFVLVLPRTVMTAPLAGACPELAQQHDNVAAAYLARLARNDIVASVRSLIIEQLPTGNCTRERVAMALHMSVATLQSRLAGSHTNFHALLNSIRLELARAYLSQSSLAVTEIAYLLGFTDLSNFTRAFKRWTGQSPSEFRSG